MDKITETEIARAGEGVEQEPSYGTGGGLTGEIIFSLYAHLPKLISHVSWDPVILGQDAVPCTTKMCTYTPKDMEDIVGVMLVM